MKRLMSLLAVLLLLLGGCGSHDNSATEEAQEETPQDLPLTAYSLPVRHYTGIDVLGDNLLLYGENEMVLLSGEDMQVISSTAIAGKSDPDSNDLQIGNGGIAYYDREDKTLYFMDEFLRLSSFMQLEEDVLGSVQLTKDWNALYYCTAEGIRKLDLDSGLSYTLKSREGNWLGITGSFLNDTVLQCRLQLSDGRIRTMMVSAENGETLWETESEDQWYGAGYLYLCSMQTDAGQEWIYGWSVGQPRNFWPEAGSEVFPLPENERAVTRTETGLSCYDLLTGRCTAALALSDGAQIDGMTWLNGCVYYLEGAKLYCWDTQLTPAEDDGVYMTYRYSLEDPDERGMEERVRRVRELESAYGVNILLWNEVTQVQPDNYSFAVEFVPEAYDAGLAALQKALARFGVELLSQSADWTQERTLNIVLVRNVTTKDGTSTDAMQYLLNGNVYIVLDIDGNVERSFYHTMGHVLDIVLLSNTDELYDWSLLNPRGFCYDYDYAANLLRDGSQYLKDGKEYFINTFAMSYPVEDRAVIWEYAVQPGNEAYFESQHMQAKLKTVCRAVRAVFKLSGEDYAWEQYLK